MRKGTDVILGAWNGGLGDQLQFSTLPEEFYKQQRRETYLLDGSDFRNKEIYDLVWGHNPYIKGIKEGRRNAGDISEIVVENTTNNWISNWEHLHGLKPTNTRPKIYYQPKKIDGFKDTILVDFTATSLKFDGVGNGYDLNLLKDKYSELKRTNSDKRFAKVVFDQTVSESKVDVDCDAEIAVTSIYHYCDLMNSCSGVWGLHSGSVALAAAVQRYNEELTINVFVSKTLYNNMMLWLENKVPPFGAFYLDCVDYVVL